jgi:hypothetical protein
MDRSLLAADLSLGEWRRDNSLVAARLPERKHLAAYQLPPAGVAGQQALRLRALLAATNLLSFVQILLRPGKSRHLASPVDHE